MARRTRGKRVFFIAVLAPMEDTPATTFDRFGKSRRARTVCLAAGCLLETSEIGKDANMDKRARMALEQVCEEEVANRHV
jgi:hypothetical protein